MPRSNVTTVSQSVEVDGVTDVVKTQPVQDADGKWVVEFRVVGTNPEDETSAGPQVFVLRLKGDTKAAVELTTPPLNF